MANKLLLALLMVVMCSLPAEAKLPRIVRRVLSPIGIPLVIAKNVIYGIKESAVYLPLEITDYWYTDSTGGGIYH